ncbi:MAG: hypothetical protein MK135_01820 [Polyangiaceae bacterium]|nr:hypothetical protein [Polyangiaceae bacterium]
MHIPSLLAGLSLLIVAIGALHFPAKNSPLPGEPEQHLNEYLGSKGCYGCHPSEFSSWKSSYHSSMTRLATEIDWQTEESPPLPFEANFHDYPVSIRLEEGKLRYRGPRLQTLGQLFINHSIPLNQHALNFDIATVDQDVVLITGSHHYLAFWINGESHEELRLFPFVYLLKEKIWLKRAEAFLQPPDALETIPRWNANCIQCHALAGQPQQREGYENGLFWESYDTEVAEFGITCEACHGPSKEHASSMRSPFQRLAARHQEARHPGTVNPQELSAARSTAICGQCHSYFSPRSPDEWWTSGHRFGFEPGDDLGATRQILKPHETSLREGEVQAPLESLFWQDGSIRVGGREYNGIIQSPCYSKGENSIGCLSCHSMHHSDPNDQLKEDLSEKSMCQQCHQAPNSVAHQLHQQESPGDNCLACHMPKTTFALSKGIRAHQISSPVTENISNASEPPQACVLCHLDQETSFFDEALGNHNKQPGFEESASTPLGIYWALSGNAAIRALLADAMGSPEVASINSTEALKQTLDILATQDEYAAVQRIAARSLKQLENSSATPTNKRHRKALSSKLSKKRMESWHQQRDRRPITISE